MFLFNSLMIVMCWTETCSCVAIKVNSFTGWKAYIFIYIDIQTQKGDNHQINNIHTLHTIIHWQCQLPLYWQQHKHVCASKDKENSMMQQGLTKVI